jgi:hypothetical protein
MYKEGFEALKVYYCSSDYRRYRSQKFALIQGAKATN